jgi:hypothetical protein
VDARKVKTAERLQPCQEACPRHDRRSERDISPAPSGTRTTVPGSTPQPVFVKPWKFIASDKRNLLDCKRFCSARPAGDCQRIQLLRQIARAQAKEEAEGFYASCQFFNDFMNTWSVLLSCVEALSFFLQDFLQSDGVRRR